jgi:hypothetical protein
MSSSGLSWLPKSATHFVGADQRWRLRVVGCAPLGKARERARAWEQLAMEAQPYWSHVCRVIN